MNAAARFADRIDFDHLDRASGIERLQHFARAAVGGRVAELCRDDGAVADVIIDIAGNKIGLGRPDVDRIGQAKDFEPFSPRVG